MGREFESQTSPAARPRAEQPLAWTSEETGPAAADPPLGPRTCDAQRGVGALLPSSELTSTCSAHTCAHSCARLHLHSPNRPPRTCSPALQGGAQREGRPVSPFQRPSRPRIGSNPDPFEACHPLLLLGPAGPASRTQLVGLEGLRLGKRVQGATNLSGLSGAGTGCGCPGKPLA